VRWGAFESLGLRPPLAAKLMMKLMELYGLAERVSGGYRLTRRGVVEVCKAVINYVVELR